MNKLYFVESELYPRTDFANESDRNEMALALWQEHIYFLAARTANWYEDGIVTGIEEDAANNIFTWECQTYFDVPTQVAYFDEHIYPLPIFIQKLYKDNFKFSEFEGLSGGTKVRQYFKVKLKITFSFS